MDSWKPKAALEPFIIVGSLTTVGKDKGHLRGRTLPRINRKGCLASWLFSRGRYEDFGDDSSSNDFKLKLGDRTKDGSGLGNASITRDDILHKEFRLRLSERSEDATDLCIA